MEEHLFICVLLLLWVKHKIHLRIFYNYSIIDSRGDLDLFADIDSFVDKDLVGKLDWCVDLDLLVEPLADLIAKNEFLDFARFELQLLDGIVDLALGVAVCFELDVNVDLDLLVAFGIDLMSWLLI